MTGMINDARPTSLEAFRSPPDPDMDFEAAVHYHNELRAYIRATRYAEGRQAARKAEADRLNDLVREIESATQLTSQPLGAGPNTEKWIDDWGSMVIALAILALLALIRFSAPVAIMNF